MGNLMASFNTGVSGLRSAQTSLNTTAHNLANASSIGYTRQSALVTDFRYVNTMGRGGSLAQIGLGTDVLGIRQIRNTFLDSQYRLQLGRQNFYETQKNTLNEVEDLFGDLFGKIGSDEKNEESFLGSVTLLYSALNEIQKESDNIVTRDQLVSLAGNLLERAQVVKSQIDAYQVNLNVEISTQVKRINELAEEITAWNQVIKSYESRGETANDYRDTRNLLMDELSQYIDMETWEDKDGAVFIHTEGSYLVAGSVSYELTTARINPSTNMLKVVWAHSKDDYVNLSKDLNYSMENNTDIGSLRSILIARGNKRANYLDLPVQPDIKDYTDSAGVVDDAAYNSAMQKFNDDKEEYNKMIFPSSITKLQAELDLYLHEIATTLNDILCPNTEITDTNGVTYKVLDVANASIGDDENRSVGTELFSRKAQSRYTLKTIEINTPSGPENIDVYVYNEEDPDEVTSLYTLDQLVINPQLVRNASMLPVSYNDGSGYAEGFNSHLFAQIIDAWDHANLPISPNDMTTYSFTDYHSAMLGEIGTQGKVWGSILEEQTMLAAEIENNRQMVMGVSNEEEMADLVKFQHCYNASSRYITVVDEMLKHIIERL